MSPSLIWELARKIVHLSGIFIVIGYTLLVDLFSDRIAILVMTAFLLLLLEIEYIRIEHRPRIIEKFRSIFRPKEENQINGASFLVISCIICFSAFDYWIAVLAIFMTVFGDFFAALVGKAVEGKKLYRDKTWAGTVAGLIVNFSVGMILLPGHYILVVLMAVVAAIVELFTIKLDDNLTVPLFAGFVGQIAVLYFHFSLLPGNLSLFGT